jgi:hypothetical protein
MDNYDMQSGYMDRYIPQTPNVQKPQGVDPNTLVIIGVCAVIIILVVVLALFMYNKKKKPQVSEMPPTQPLYYQKQPPPNTHSSSKHVVDLRPHVNRSPIQEENNSEVDYHALAQQLPEPAHDTPPVDNILPKVKPPEMDNEDQEEGINKLINGGDEENPIIKPSIFENEKLNDESEEVKIPSRISSRFIHMDDPKYEPLTHHKISVVKLIELTNECDDPEFKKWVAQRNISSSIKKYTNSL